MLKTMLALAVLLVLFGVVGRMDYEMAAAQSSERETQWSCPPAQPESPDEAMVRRAVRGKRIVSGMDTTCPICSREA